jgi:UDP-GlcNAc:undecaprenyl-phosphate GlcNAc-1-phosphate transferase
MRIAGQCLCYNRRMSFPEALRALVGDGAAVWGFLTAIGIVLALTPLIARLAPRVGGVDVGGDRPRVHQSPVPRIGGVAIVVAILVPAVIFIHPEGPYLGIFVGTLLVAALGLVDDIRGLRPSTKFIGVCIVALIPVLGYDPFAFERTAEFGVHFQHLTLPVFGDFDLGWVGYPLTILWVAVLANLINLIDGMDSLAAGIVSIAAMSFAVLAASFGRSNAAVLAAIICGATLAFLRHNYHPAKIFMGDSGALALGFLLATVAVEGVLKTAATIALVAPLLVLAVPILDTSFVVLKRLKYHRPPWDPDQNHFYHRLMRIGLSQRRTAAYLHLWALLLAAWAVMLRFVPPRPRGVWNLEHVLIAAGTGLVVIAASIWMVYSLEILKARHLRVLGFGREPTEELPAEEPEEAVERALAGPRS